LKEPVETRKGRRRARWEKEKKGDTRKIQVRGPPARQKKKDCVRGKKKGSPEKKKRGPPNRAGPGHGNSKKEPQHKHRKKRKKKKTRVKSIHKTTQWRKKKTSQQGTSELQVVGFEEKNKTKLDLAEEQDCPHWGIISKKKRGTVSDGALTPAEAQIVGRRGNKSKPGVRKSGRKGGRSNTTTIR